KGGDSSWEGAARPVIFNGIWEQDRSFRDDQGIRWPCLRIFHAEGHGLVNKMVIWNVVKALCGVAKRCAVVLTASLTLSSLAVPAQNPLLFITGLPCPGGQNEPTNSHALVW